MGWFDEQIKSRKIADNTAFEEAFQDIAGAVMGRRLSEALNDDRRVTTDAVGEILKYYHIKAQEVPDNIQDMNEVLEYLLRPHSIMYRTVHLEDGWYKDASGPMLATRQDDGSAVALLPARVYGYRFYDRKTGKWVRLNRKTQHLLELDAYVFYKPLPLNKMNIMSLVKYLAQQISMSDMITLVAAILIVTMVGKLKPYLDHLLLSDVLASGSTTVLMAIGAFIVSAEISLLLFKAFQSLVNSRITTKLSLNLESATMMRILSLPANFFKDYSAGDLSTRAANVNSLADQLVNMVLTTGLTSLFSLIYITDILHYAPALVVPSLIITLLTVALTTVHILLEVRVTRQRMELATKENGMSYQLISGIQKIRLSGAEKRAFARWGRLYSEEAMLEYNPPMFLKISSVLTKAVTLLGTIAMYYAAISSNVTISQYYAFSSAYGMVNGAFVSLAGIATAIAQIRPTLEMTRPILEAIPEISEDKQMVTRLSGQIELSNVTFRYREDMPNVLDNLSLKIRPGQYVAVVGRTGCGKSTLMRVMLGFETPQKGAVYYDGKDLTRLDLKSLRRRIGAVMQNGKLFSGDIYSNIVITAPWLTMDDAWEAAETASIADDIKAMPMGMYTMISEGQGGISGGQRQRLLIARAVAPKPKILIFDEATSALDNLSQKKVSEALDKLKCTRIVIAHRLSTIRKCDRIIVLDHGNIVEDGSYDELIRRNGYFAELVKRQRLDLNEADGDQSSEQD